MAPAPLIAIIDDDDAIREALADLTLAIGYRSAPYESAEAFLRLPPDEMPACLLLDVQMPGMSGLELQEHLRGQGQTMPVIFITSLVDPDVVDRAMQQGAHCVLRKPTKSETIEHCLYTAVHGLPAE